MQVASYLFYARAPHALVLLQMRHSLRAFWAAGPHHISRTNVFDPNYFVWMQTFGCLVQRSARVRREYTRLGTPALPGGDHVPTHFEPHQYCLRAMALTEADRQVIERGPLFKLSYKTAVTSPPDACGGNLSQPGAISVYDYFLTRRAWR